MSSMSLVGRTEYMYRIYVQNICTEYMYRIYRIYVQNILDPKIWKLLLQKSPKNVATSVVPIDIYTEHTRSKNMETNIKGNHNTILMSILEKNPKSDDSMVVYGFS